MLVNSTNLQDSFYEMDFSLEDLSDDPYEWPQNPDSLAEISTDHNDSSPVTPKSDTLTPLDFNSCHGSSDVSLSHDSDSSYSELDSEAEAFYSSLKHHQGSPGAIDSHDLAAAENQISYGELMKKYVQCEEELQNTRLKLQESEQEIEKLKGETEKENIDGLLTSQLFLEARVKESESCGEVLKFVIRNVRAELETAQREIEKKDINIETEKSRVFELQRQVVDLETKLLDSSYKFENLVHELVLSKECLAVSGAEISKLEEMLCYCQQSFCTEKAKLKTDIDGLLASQLFLEAQVKETESRGELLQCVIRNSDAYEVELQDEISALKTDLTLRDRSFEAMNKDFNMLKAEKDEVSTELDNLKAEMRTRDIELEQMKEQLNGLLHNTVSELKATVRELEKQTELQRNAIAEGEEEKREAIRQLCFSLDHLKTENRQLLRFLSGNNKQSCLLHPMQF